jgi:hypothetical protein
LESLERLLARYRGLFKQANESTPEGGVTDFGERWGLFSVIVSMSELHNISINEATKLGAIEFLNWWSYMVEKEDYEKNSK